MDIFRYLRKYDYYIEKVLFEYAKDPITIIVLDKVGNRYLLHCIENGICSEWLKIQIDNNRIIEILKYDLTIYNFIIESKEVCYIRFDIIGECENKFCDGNIDEDLLPSEKFYITQRDYTKYIMQLECANNKIFIDVVKDMNEVKIPQVKGTQGKTCNKLRFRRISRVKDRRIISAKFNKKGCLVW